MSKVSDLIQGLHHLRGCVDSIAVDRAALRAGVDRLIAEAEDIERTNLQAAKPADVLGSLPVVAYIRYAHNDSQRFLSFDPSRNETHTPLTAHATATAEIAKRDEEIAELKLELKVSDKLERERLRELRAQLAEAQKDAGRLDWLEAQTEAHGFCHVGHGEYRHYAHQIKGYNTVRQALDAAMQSAQEKV